MNTKELIRGQTYTVAESCGMLALTGEYLGKFKKGYRFECFVFKRTDPLSESSYPYFGAVWRIADESNETPRLYLYNTHYGDSTKKLKKVQDQYGQEIQLDFDDEQ